MESHGYVCAPGKVCLLRGTRKAASNLISPESKYLREGKRHFTMVDIFPTFSFSFFSIDRARLSRCVAKNCRDFSEESELRPSDCLPRDFHSAILIMIIYDNSDSRANVCKANVKVVLIF